jgi:hypothetical protein
VQGLRSSGPREWATAGKEAHWILQSDHSARKAFLASVECSAAGALPGMAVWEPSWTPLLAHSYLQALQRKTNDVVIFILNCASSPCLPREAVVGRRGTGDPSHVFSMDVCVGVSFSCLCCNLSFPKQEVNTQTHLSPKWSFTISKTLP